MTSAKKNAETSTKKSSAKSKTPSANAGRRVIKFELEDIPGKNVFLAGSFNDWQLTSPMTDKNGDGIYTCQLRLVPGEYQYKFVVDGEWRLDSSNSCFAPNGFGELNSVLKVVEKTK